MNIIKFLLAQNCDRRAKKCEFAISDGLQHIAAEIYCLTHWNLPDEIFREERNQDITVKNKIYVI